MIGERIERARNAAGLSLRELGHILGISHTAVRKYEKENLMPSSKQLLQLAKAVGVRTDYFFRPVEVKIEGIEYRKRSNITQKVLKRITSDVYEQAERWEELLGLYPQQPIPDFALLDELPAIVADGEAIESIAEQMRHAWELGLNPISDLIDTLESRGIMVIVSPIDAGKKFDGLAGTIGDKPIVVVSAEWSGDRQRFTLAHELGHLVLHGRLPEGMKEEAACNHFAGAFLLPKSAVLDAFGSHRRAIDLNELSMLKEEFGLSMSSILYRVAQCGVKSDSYRKHMLIFFSQKGWCKNEPGMPYPAEKTWLFLRLVYRAFSEEYIGESKAAELLGKSLRNFRMDSVLEHVNAGTH